MSYINVCHELLYTSHVNKDYLTLPSKNLVPFKTNHLFLFLSEK